MDVGFARPEPALVDPACLEPLLALGLDRTASVDRWYGRRGKRGIVDALELEFASTSFVRPDDFVYSETLEAALRTDSSLSDSSVSLSDIEMLSRVVLLKFERGGGEMRV